MNLPLEYIEYMQKLLGSDYSAYIDSLNDNSYHGLRVNRLKISADQFNEIAPFDLDKIPYIDNGFTYSGNNNPAKDAYYHAGLYYLQEPSAMLPANRLLIEEGDRVLDLCAAPGGKAKELAVKIGIKVILYANDISASRAMALLKNLELSGAKNIYVTAETPENLSKKLPLFFNKILCDVPCSGEGMFRKDPSLIKSWVEKGPLYYRDIQRSIVSSAYEMLAHGGLLMYSTCTFSKIEDEENITWFLEKYRDMKLIKIAGYEGFTEGYDGLSECVRVFPHKMMGEGHFLALMKKDEGGLNIAKSELTESKIIKKISKDKKETIEYMLPPYKDNGYRNNIRYLRTGLMLNYSESYAMSLKKDDFDNNLFLSHDDVRIIKYLKGETIFLEGNEYLKKGLGLVFVDDYPLGFVKSDGSTKLKNLYNKGWRMK
ncbi:MAG: SAM-dependent methyltransferase [Lachnospiraceae bacterium]|nr:SAM-dependent methyltransferase [Lachnospiraceae bacterium]